MKIDVDGAIKHIGAQLDADKKQVQFATRVALTRTAMLVKAAEEREIRDVFDRPTPFTQASLFVRAATSTRLDAEVKLKDFAGKGTAAADFLAAQIKGGERKQKRFERALQSVGALPAGYRAVPGSAARLDSYGNMDRGQIVQILAYFRAFPESGYKANMTNKKRASLARGSKTRPGYAYFVGRPGRLPLGIYQRFRFGSGSAIKPVMIFVRSALYRPLLDFEFVAKNTIDQEFNRQFVHALQDALRTAR